MIFAELIARTKFSNKFYEISKLIIKNDFDEIIHSLIYGQSQKIIL